jgi:hypothetical protein
MSFLGTTPCACACASSQAQSGKPLGSKSDAERARSTLALRSVTRRWVGEPAPRLDLELSSVDALGGDKRWLEVLMLSVQRPKIDPDRFCGRVLLSSWPGPGEGCGTWEGRRESRSRKVTVAIPG